MYVCVYIYIYIYILKTWKEIWMASILLAVYIENFKLVY